MIPKTRGRYCFHIPALHTLAALGYLPAAFIAKGDNHV